MKLPLYIIDAFADRSMQGNPAGVCPLERWLPDDRMQAIAAELNLSETVFFAKREGGGEDTYDIRWFTPTKEVDMIGHATLAAGHLVLNSIDPLADEATFYSGRDVMAVRRDGRNLEIEMPSLIPERITPPTGLAEALGAKPTEVWSAKHYLAVFQSAGEIADLSPDFASLAGLPLPAVIVTAPSNGEFDFVSRFFAPANGVPEDPVSGVAHCCLTPFWSRRLGRSDLVGRQISARGGTVRCGNRGNRIILSGAASVFLEGTISI